MSHPTLPMKRLCLYLVAAALACVPPVRAAGPATESAPRPKITVDKSTTFFTAPLRADGTVNYVQALDELLGKGLTKENNLFFGLLQISGTGSNQFAPKFANYLLKRYALQETKDIWIPYKAENPQNHKEADVLDSLYKAPWKKADHPRIAEWLAQNEEALARITEAAKVDHYMIPMWGGDDGRMLYVLLPSLSRNREYGNTLCSRATLRLGSGDLAGCQQDLLTAHRLGRLMTQKGILITNLVGVAIETRASLADVTLATSGKLSAKDAAAYLAQLDHLPEFQPIWESADLAERCTLLDETTRAARQGRQSLLELFGAASAGEHPVAKDPGDESSIPFIPFTDQQLIGLDYDVVLKQINAEYDALVAAMKIPDAAARAAALEKSTLHLAAMKRDWEKEFKDGKDLNSAFAHFLVGMMMPALGKVAEIDQTGRVRADQARIALALAAYHADHQAYPDSLDALTTGKYLAQLPPDRYSAKAGEPYRYLRNGDNYTLYSLGQNLQDDNGKPGRNMEGDLVITSTPNP